VILDYIRHYGDEQIGGMQFIGGITKLGSEEAMSVLTAEFLGIFPNLVSSDVETSVRGLKGLLQLCFAGELSPSELYSMLGYNVTVPPYVRQEMFSRAFSNDDILPKILQTSIDYPWRWRCDCQSCSSGPAQGSHASRPSTGTSKCRPRSLLGRHARLQ
jgi:hypothetical protein